MVPPYAATPSLYSRADHFSASDLRGRPILAGFARQHIELIALFRELLSYMGDVVLEAKLEEWERLYKFAGSHRAHNGKTPYEALREKL